MIDMLDSFLQGKRVSRELLFSNCIAVDLSGSSQQYGVRSVMIRPPVTRHSLPGFVVKTMEASTDRKILTIGVGLRQNLAVTQQGCQWRLETSLAGRNCARAGICPLLFDQGLTSAGPAGS